ncbi:MAG: DinB family protein [Gemmatimonadaceae bacterium]|jgi:hypothetical protein|nr:DinB family protein [Gemmatimonadaceae bacterium]
MHPRLAAAIGHAEQARMALLDAVETLPPELREARPSLEAWSAAEILEHLARVEKGIAKLFALRVGELRATPGAPREGDEWPAVDAARFAGVDDRGLRRNAPDRTRPSGELSADAALRALRETRALLLSEAMRGDGLALGTVTHPHPFLGELDLYEWIWFIGAHEQRHTAQLRDLAAHFATT